VESTLPNEDGVIHITLEVAQESIQRRAVLYDKTATPITIPSLLLSNRCAGSTRTLPSTAGQDALRRGDPRFILRRLISLPGRISPG